MKRNLMVSVLLAVLFILLLTVVPVSAAVSALDLKGTALRVRALHLVTRGVTPSGIMRLIDMAKEAKFNTIILGICWRGSTLLNSMSWVEPGKNAWKREDLLAVVNYARNKGIEVVPHVPLLSHQEKFLGTTFPQLMYNAVTYDPRNPKVYELVLPVLDEIIELLHPQAFLIGHDEVVGWKAKHFEKKFLKPGESTLPAELFLSDVERLHSHLQKHGVETWMWGDMLIAPKEFPTMHAGGLHGSVAGYGAELRKQLPKDIVICDWHYFDKQPDFPSLAAFKQEGFRVLGSTWKRQETIRNFSRYAARHRADGMIATTWFHVQKKEWEVVEEIISISGKAFLNAN